MEQSIEQPKRTKIVLAFDEEVIRELEDTTETKSACQTALHYLIKGCLCVRANIH